MSKKIKLEKNSKKRSIKLFDFKEIISASNFVKGAHIELFSNKQAIVEHCFGVYEYTDKMIKLNIGKGSAVFYGSGLEIKTLEGKNLTISGNISSVEFNV